MPFSSLVKCTVQWLAMHLQSFAAIATVGCRNILPHTPSLPSPSPRPPHPRHRSCILCLCVCPFWTFPVNGTMPPAVLCGGSLPRTWCWRGPWASQSPAVPLFFSLVKPVPSCGVFVSSGCGNKTPQMGAHAARMLPSRFWRRVSKIGGPAGSAAGSVSSELS